MVAPCLPLRILATVVFACSLQGRAHAFAWPDVPERIERDLSSPNVDTRRVATRSLSSLTSRRAGPLILSAMADPDVDVRLESSRAAAALQLGEATSRAMTWLTDHDSRIRISACKLALAVPAPNIASALARALADSDAAVRGACAEAMGAQTASDAVTPLSARLDDASPAVRVQVARALGRLRDRRSVLPLLGKARDTAPEVREEVIRSLGTLGDERAHSSVLLALRDDAVEVRVAAARALAHLRALESAPALAELAVDRNLFVRQAALSALGDLGSPAAVQSLVQLAEREEGSLGLAPTPVRSALVAAGEGALAVLTYEAAKPSSKATGATAAWVLGELHAASSADALAATLRGGTTPPEVALHGLAGAGTAAQVPLVLEFLQHSSLTVRSEARHAATVLLSPIHPDGRAVDPLVAALRDRRSSPAERAELATALARTGSPRAAVTLAGLVHANDMATQLAAIDGLGLLASVSSNHEIEEASDASLIPLLAHADERLRMHAASAAGAGASLRSARLLLAALDSDGPIVHLAALTALAGIFERYPTDLVERLYGMLWRVAGPERDAVLEAIARARWPGALTRLLEVTRSEDVEDRRSIASFLGSRGPSATAMVSQLTRDPDPGVRANAVWTLGLLGGSAEISIAANLTADPNANVKGNAVAALARLLARNEPSAVAAAALCPLLASSQSRARANALVGLAEARTRCGDGARERSLLTTDASDFVRRRAALLLTRVPLGGDHDAFELCKRGDVSSDVAMACAVRFPQAPTYSSRGSAFFIFDETGSSPKRETPYVIDYLDSYIRGGFADRRGVVFDPHPVAGEAQLRRAETM